MRSWTENGYGFSLFTGENAKKVVAFLQGKKKFLEDIYGKEEADKVVEELAGMAEIEDDEDVVSALQDAFEFNPSGTIAQIINKETGALGFDGFCCDGDCDTYDTVMYVPAYPWQMSEVDQALTQDKLDKILKPYMKSLGVPFEELGEQELEYFG